MSKKQNKPTQPPADAAATSVDAGILHDITDRKEAEALIREQEIKYRTVADFAYDWEMWSGQEKRLCYCSPSCERITGYSAEEFLGDPDLILRIVHPDDRKAMATHMEMAENEQAGVSHLDYRIITRQGQTRWIGHVCAPVTAPGGASLGRRISNRDITEQKQSAEEAVALKEALDSVDGFVFAKDIDLNYISANRSFCDLLKIPYNKIQGMTDYDIFPADLAAKYIADDKRVIETAKEITVEEETINASTNQRFIVQTRKFPRIDKNGRVTGIYGVGYDVTALKQAEYALRESEKQFRKILDFAPVGVFLDDKDGKAIFINRKCGELIGVPQQKLYNFDWKPFLHPDDRDRMVSEWEKAFTNKTAFRLAYRWVHPGGEVVWTLGEVVPVVDDNGALSCYIGTLTDITAHKQAEDAIKESRKLIEAKNKELEQLVYVGSHDLRSPLVNVDGFSQELDFALTELCDLAKTSKDPAVVVNALLTEYPDMRKSISRIRASTAQMDNLLKALLKLSRAGRAALQIDRLDMDQVLRRLVPSFAYRLQAGGITLNIEPLPPCRGDAVQVTQVFANLIDNAIKYLNEERLGIITISGGADGNRPHYRVADNGIGMDGKYLPRIFELFYRIKETESDGDGIGLTMVRQILQRMDGEISADSKPGEGSVFIVSLPGCAREA